MDSQQGITVLKGRGGFQASVRETEPPGTWELEWDGALDESRAYRVLRNAGTAVLRNGGERIAVTCPPDQEALLRTLGKWPEPEVARTGDRYLLELMVPAAAGDSQV